MRRRLLNNLLTVLSLLLCVAAAALWVRSLWTADIVHFVPSDSEPGGNRCWSYRLASAFPSIHFQVWHKRPDASLRLPPPGFSHERHKRPRSGIIPGSAARRLGLGCAATEWWVACWVPLWVVAVVAAVLSAARTASWAGSCRRVRRLQRNQCPGCGYDLRATPGRCPECGTNATAPG